MNAAPWTTLGELKPGTLFELEGGRKGVRSSSASEHGEYITTAPPCVSARCPPPARPPAR